jgi:hypothetical protein
MKDSRMKFKKPSVYFWLFLLVSPLLMMEAAFFLIRLLLIGLHFISWLSGLTILWPILLVLKYFVFNSFYTKDIKMKSYQETVYYLLSETKRRFYLLKESAEWIS